MERVSFLLEESGERLACLLNPESVVLRRRSGLRDRTLGGRPVTGRSAREDALLFTGGGRTELHLDLLFDVSVSGSSLETQNVRDLTRPLWELAENRGRGDGGEGGRDGVPQVRFVWGKTWSVPGVVEGVAERLERFDRQGVPRRSWLRMRLIRVSESPADRDGNPPEAPRPPLRVEERGRSGRSERSQVHEIVGGGGGGGEDGRVGATERLDQLAQRYYGNPAYWRVLALYNDVDDPLRLEAGRRLEVPPPSVVEGP